MPFILHFHSHEVAHWPLQLPSPSCLPLDILDCILMHAANLRMLFSTLE
ncbi:hypothetical protein EWM64_g9366 [Hericium alpestre]|uniref:Uncharacterized protein n=1 Tax=Hericium alpestre TaxID=135208 RepID=A0A4Y9ZJ84_9AGAM|nr:hypothetical protein EWM64_g9366 [Hericium alpestre]